MAVATCDHLEALLHFRHEAKAPKKLIVTDQRRKWNRLHLERSREPIPDVWGLLFHLKSKSLPMPDDFFKQL